MQGATAQLPGIVDTPRVQCPCCGTWTWWYGVRPRKGRAHWVDRPVRLQVATVTSKGWRRGFAQVAHDLGVEWFGYQGETRESTRGILAKLRDRLRAAIAAINRLIGDDARFTPWLESANDQWREGGASAPALTESNVARTATGSASTPATAPLPSTSASASPPQMGASEPTSGSSEPVWLQDSRSTWRDE